MPSDYVEDAAEERLDDSNDDNNNSSDSDNDGSDSDDDRFPSDVEDELEYYSTRSKAKGPLGRSTKSLNILKNLSHRRLAARMRRVIKFMAKEGFDTGTFAFFLTSGWTTGSKDDEVLDPGDKDDEYTHEDNLRKIKYHRSGFTGCPMMPSILKNLHRPPRKHGRGVRTKAAREVMDTWSIGNVKELIDKDMKSLVKLMACPPSDVTEELLLSIDFEESIVQAQQLAPTLWDILSDAAYTNRQHKRNAKKDPEEVSKILLLFSG